MAEKLPTFWMMFGLLVWSAAHAAAPSYSCLSPDTDLPQDALGMTLTSDSQGAVWQAAVFKQATGAVLGTFDMRRLSDSEDFTVFGGMKMSMTLFSREEWGHRRAQIQLPALGIDSNKWICKAIP